MDLRTMLNTEGGGDRGGAAAARGPTATGSAGSPSSQHSSQPPPAPAPLAMPSPGINGHHSSSAHPQSATPSSSSAAPATPVQGPSQNAFRDYSHSTHASPVAQHREYPPPVGPYQSPTSYHPPPSAFANRPHVPPIQPHGHGPSHGHGHEMRSPGSRSMPAPSPSSYRQTPPASSVTPGGASAYPFPPTSQPPMPASPGQRQYPSGAGYTPHDSYSSQQQSPGPPPVGMPSRMSSHGSASSYGQTQQQPAVPQTSPISTPVGGPGGAGAAAYMQHQQHQRSHSIQSVSTPTSAHSQQLPYGPPYVQGSPIPAAHQALPHQQQHQHQHQNQHPHPHQQPQRQSSQPPTPLGPPMPGPLRQSPASTYREPPSPYQQRTSSITNTTFSHQHMHSSPPPPSPATIQFQQQQQQQQQQRLSNSGRGAYDNSAVAAAVTSESHQRSVSQHSRSERERSISVSPKTRVPSLPSSAGQDIIHNHPRPLPPSQSHIQSQSQAQPQPPAQPQFQSQLHSHSHFHTQPQPQSESQSQSQSQPPSNTSAATTPTMEPHREVTPAKRKLDDRNLSPDELQTSRRPPQPQPATPSGTNGNDYASPQMATRSPHTDSHSIPRPKRVRYTSTPTFAQTARGRSLGPSRNFSLKQHLKRSAQGKIVNGNGSQPDAPTSVKSEHASRHGSPETTRSTTTAPGKTDDHAMADRPDTEAKDPKMFAGRPFPWEPSIENQKPMDMFSKAVGDFLFFNVLTNGNIEEIRSRGVQFEIEAKLGTIIDKSTNDRIYLPVRVGECVMGDEARIAFRSSMTEGQHRVMNQWLNQQVQESHPKNPRAATRLEVKYKHRREVDRFFELPASQFIQRLPHCIASALPSSASTLKARISYDQVTGDVLAKIVKGRVADLNVHFPHLPLDCRISINLEWEWEGSVEEITAGHASHRERQPDRHKDRLSYTHGFYQIDLTQVTQGDQGGGGKEHELEVELDAAVVLEHGNLLMKSLPHRFENLVDGFTDNIRVLARRCPPPT